MKTVLRAIGFIWSLPLTLIGLLWMVVACRPRQIWWNPDGWCIEAHVGWLPMRAAGETFGHLCMFTTSEFESIRRHERIHTAQGDVLGLLFLPAYGIASLISRLRGTGWYWGNAFEAQARARSGQ